MKKLFFFAACALAVVLPSASKAEIREGTYASAVAGASFLENAKHGGDHGKFETGAIGSLALGYGWCQGVRVELEGSYRWNKFKHSSNNHIDVWSAFVNGFYDFDTCWELNPYLGLGFGWAHTHLRNRSSGSSFHKDNNKFAGQAIAGLSYTLNCSTDLFVEYRFFKTTHRHYKDHNVGAGVRTFF